MNNQEAIKELKDCAAYIINDNNEREYSLCDKNIAIEMAIQALEEQDKHRWIPTSESLPDIKSTFLETHSFLTQDKNGHTQVLEYADGWNCTVGINGNIIRENEIKDIVAWQRIEPYKKEM